MQECPWVALEKGKGGLREKEHLTEWGGVQERANNERERERERDRDRQTDRQTDTHTHTHTQNETREGLARETH